eukprot:TRINITY_DN1_c0_g1_i5.p1 TRINITY_DN1_c0_g1~~TRINITY_DN1_c0_g1_i5.p1  ORF type:complete len:334 (-),score=59.43 TRINITY_DN1_c0_g1_i5:136-1104(-)
MKAVALASLALAATARTLDEDLYLFADFKQTYNRKYTAGEEVHRLGCFRRTLDTIDRLNVLGQELHGINKFSDLCPEEFKAYHNLQVPKNRSVNKVAPLYSAEEILKAKQTSIDWRQKGAVTHVKDQGQCGSCWSFSATGNMEGQWFLKKDQLVGLSEQELVSCSHNGNQGCNGGLMDYAFQWVHQNNGIDSESDYPYVSGTGNTGTCDNSKLGKSVATFSSYTDVSKNEDQMLAWLSQDGPLSIAVDAQMGWQTYRGGIMSTCSGTQLDHGVLAVGYGAGATPYWIVKNSWGTSWGESGYIRLQYGTNQCGLNQMPSSAQV